MSLLIVLPSRSRPKKFIGCMENIFSCADPKNILFCATHDYDDPSMKNWDMREATATRFQKWGIEGMVHFGTSISKINAVNRDIAFFTRFYPDWKILLLTSDDFWFEPGFDTEILKAFETYFPDYDGLLHVPDGFANERLCTLPIMGRKYYDRFGYIYHPGYKSVFADNEQHEVARRLGKYYYHNIHIARHDHPIWGRAPMDEQYRRNENPILYTSDRKMYNFRKSQNFNLPE